MGSEPPIPAVVGESVSSGNAQGGMFDEVGFLVGVGVSSPIDGAPVDAISAAIGDEVISESVELADGAFVDAVSPVEPADGAVVDDTSPADGVAVDAASVELDDG